MKYHAELCGTWLQVQLKLLLGDAGGYFATAGQDPSILLRMKEEYDGAEPSASSIAVSEAHCQTIVLHCHVCLSMYRKPAQPNHKRSLLLPNLSH